MRLIKDKQVVQEDSTSTDHLDLSEAVRVTMPNLKFSTETISLRMPVALLNSIRREANRHDIPYQSLIKMSLAEKFG
ncbi:MAG: CopG family antitoxin [Spartobacteria bacterium]